MATMLDGNVPQPVVHDDWTFRSGASSDSGTYRGIGSSWFNAENIAAEDFMRDQQAQQLSFERDMQQQHDSQAFTASENQLNRDFNASEAEKAFDREKWLASNQYSMAIEDMKKNGLNPILAYSQGGASTHAASQASYSGSSSGYSSGRQGGYRSSSSKDPLNSLLPVVASIVGKYVSGKIGLQSGLLRDSAFLDKQLSSDLSLLNYKEAQSLRKRFRIGF